MTTAEWSGLWIGFGGAVLLTWPANLAVRNLLRLARVGPVTDVNRAGRWIGALERLLIYVLVIMGAAAAAGLVIAAKSILRFPEISAKPAAIDPEYVLVGSLASWLIAFGLGGLVVAIT
jgi:hypothetical protein